MKLSIMNSQLPFLHTTADVLADRKHNGNKININTALALVPYEADTRSQITNKAQGQQQALL